MEARKINSKHFHKGKRCLDSSHSFMGVRSQLILVMLFFSSFARQHFLYFFPLPHGQGSFLPIFLIALKVLMELRFFSEERLEGELPFSCHWWLWFAYSTACCIKAVASLRLSVTMQSKRGCKPAMDFSPFMNENCITLMASLNLSSLVISCFSISASNFSK